MIDHNKNARNTYINSLVAHPGLPSPIFSHSADPPRCPPPASLSPGLADARLGGRRGRRRVLHSGHGCVVYCRDRGREARARAVVRPVARDAAGDVTVAPPLGGPEVSVVDYLVTGIVL